MIAIGVVSLQPSPRYFPLRLHCTKLLLQLTKTATPPLYVPTGSLLLDILTYEAFAKKPKHYVGKTPKLAFLLRVSDSLMGTRAYLQPLFSELHHQLTTFFASYARSVAFADLVVPAIMSLKQFCKRCRLSEFTARGALADTF